MRMNFFSGLRSEDSKHKLIEAQRNKKGLNLFYSLAFLQFSDHEQFFVGTSKKNI